MRFSGALLVLGLLGSGCGAPERSDVLVIVVDTLRANHLHAYGYPRETTPHLDRLAAAGVRFDVAIATSSWSAPSHPSIMTGLSPDRHGVLGWNDSIDPAAVTLAERLGERGYATGIFSSHGGLRKAVGEFNRGFQTSFGTSRKHDDRTLDRALAWIRGAESPWYAHVILMTMHAPYERYPEEFDRTLFTDLPPAGDRVFPEVHHTVRIGDHLNSAYYINRYDRSLRHLDALVGSFLEALHDEGRLRNAHVVVTSDHGESFGDHGGFGHSAELYDTLVRVPLLLVGPGVPPGLVWREPVSTLDIVPTLHGLAGLAVPAGLEGIDLSPHLRSGTRPDPRLLLAMLGHNRFGTTMVRGTRYKLIRYKRRGEELYDLHADPGEQHNRIGDASPEVARVLAVLRPALDHLGTAEDRAADVARPLSDDAAQTLKALGYLADEDEPPPP